MGAVKNDDWGSSEDTKEHKQAEFLLEWRCPWPLIRGIGVHSEEVKSQVLGQLGQSTHKPRVEVIRLVLLEGEERRATVIEYKTGNIIDNQDAEALVNTVNCQGFMGRGVALAFKKTYPGNFKEYQEACQKGEVQPGRMLVHKTDELPSRWIINFPTKNHWRRNSKMQYIDSGLDDLVRVIKKHKIASIALPALGCGLGGLQWAEVKKRIDESLSKLPDCKVTVYEPHEANSKRSLKPKRRAITKPATTSKKEETQGELAL